NLKKIARGFWTSPDQGGSRTRLRGCGPTFVVEDRPAIERARVQALEHFGPELQKRMRNVYATFGHPPVAVKAPQADQPRFVTIRVGWVFASAASERPPFHPAAPVNPDEPPPGVVGVRSLRSRTPTLRKTRRPVRHDPIGEQPVPVERLRVHAMGFG